MKGPFPSSIEPLFALPALSTDIELYIEFVLAGLSGFEGDATFEDIDPTRPEGKLSSIGDKAFGSNVIFVGEIWETPSKPRPAMCSGSSGGGVGVRGGMGIGRLNAMALRHP